MKGLYQWFFQNIGKAWRKIFEKGYFSDFLNMMKFRKKNPEDMIASTKTNGISAKSP